MRRLRGGMLVLALTALLALLAGCNQAAGDLEVGQCFNAPTTDSEVTDVESKKCDEAHTAEVIYVGNMPDAETVPTGTQFDTYVADNCIPAFNDYTGLDFETAEEYDINSLTPTNDGWGDGDREVTCFIVRVDGGEMTESLKAG